MRNFIQNGERMHITATDDVKGGELVRVGDIVAIAATDAVKDVVYSASVSGVYSLPKVAGEAIEQGKRCYLDASGAVTGTASEVVVGVAWSASSAGDATVSVKINM